MSAEGRRRRALLVKFGAIGDVIMAVPAARALYDAGFDVDWMCGGAVRPLLECYPWVRALKVRDAALVRGSAAERFGAIWAAWRQVAGVRYDLCATLYYDRRYDVLTLPVRAARKFRLAHGVRDRELLAGRHHTDEFVRILLQREDSCRVESTPPVGPQRLPKSPLGILQSARRIALVPGGASNLVRAQILRRWPVKRYVELTRSLLERGWEVVLVGGPEDAWVRPSFAGAQVTDVIGKLTLPEVVSAFGDCDGIVSHDTGPLHLAGLTATPLVGLFGPTDPATRIPRRPLAVGLWGGQGFACRPCYDGRDFAPCRDNGCMQQMEVAHVLRELDRLLAERDAGVEAEWRVVVPFEGGSFLNSSELGV